MRPGGLLLLALGLLHSPGICAALGRAQQAGGAQGRGQRRPHHHTYYTPDLPDTCGPHTFLPGHWAGNASRRGGRQLYGTNYAQRTIWLSQHPQDCAGARFLLTPQHPTGGIGSVVHIAGQALALAVALGRVLLMEHSPAAPWHDPAWCGAGQAFDACYFVPLSACGAPPGAAGAPTLTSWEQARALHSTPALRVGYEFVERTRKDPRAWEPFAQLLAASPLHPAKHFYWWRAQSAAYILRPSARLLAEMAALREQRFRAGPLAPGTVSVHIRRGDKVTETPNTATGAYLRRAEEALALRPRVLSRRIFLSTDDPGAVAELTAEGGVAAGWAVAYVDLPREDTANGSILQRARERGPGREMVESLLNLELALECEAWVSTLTSNWGRLIDELRSTVRCKADGLYLDAQQADPPVNFEW